MIKNKKLVGIPLFIIMIIFLLCKIILIRNQMILLKNNESALKDSVLSINENTTVMLNKITPFDWDNVYFFCPYVSKKYIFDVVGDKWFGIGNSVNDSDSIIVFIKNNRVVCSYCSWKNDAYYRINYSSELFKNQHYIMYSNSDEIRLNVDKTFGYITLNFIDTTK